MHLLSVTPNPAIDIRIEVARLEWGETLQASSSRRAAGGKGLNMARAAAMLGHQATAVFLGGGPSGRFLAEELDLSGIDPVLVSIRGETRTNTEIHAADGRTLKVNLPGPEIRPEEARALVGAMVEKLPGSSAAAVAGSIPPGFPEAAFDELLDRIVRSGKPLLIDLQGPWLRRACRRARPMLVKPNVAELDAAVGGRALTSPKAILEAGRELISWGARNVAITDGPRTAYLLNARGTWSAVPTPSHGAAIAGMGDAFGVGFMAAKLDGAPDEECFATAMAWGGAAASVASLDLLTLDMVDLTRRGVNVRKVEV